MTAKDGHEKLIGQYEESLENTQDARKDAETCRDYYDGKQLTPEELQALQLRKQPAVISNRIAPKIDALLGYEKKQRTDPKAYPRTPKHEKEAQSCTDALRFVCDENNFQQIRSEVAENNFLEGAGAVVVGVKKKGNGQVDVSLNHIPWDRFYYDPHSRKRDFSDANYLGVVVWMDEEDAQRTYGGKEDVIAGCYLESESDSDTFGDRPKLPWSDKRRKRVRVLQHRYLEGGTWMQATLCKGGYLRDPQPSPFLDEDGRPECDIIAQSAYVDRENNRYGPAKRMISPQDEINKRRSKALHLLNSRQIIAERGAVDDVEQARREANRPDGYNEVTPGMRFEYVDAPGLVAGQFQLLQEAKAEIDSSGVNPALEGDIKASSGRAQELFTQAGLAEQAVVFDGLRSWSWRVYKAIWNRVRQYWTEERWVRVTDDANNLRWVGINTPAMDESGQPIMGPDGRPQRQNVIAEVDVDILLEDGPDSVTIQAEQYEQLVELKKADPMAIQTKHIIQASDLRNKDEILKDMEQGGVPPQVKQQMQEMQQALQDCQQQLQQAEMAKGQEKAECNAIKAQVSADIKVAQAELAAREAQLAQQAAEMKLEQLMQGHDLRIRAFEAQTDRIQALQPDQPKEN